MPKERHRTERQGYIFLLLAAPAAPSLSTGEVKKKCQNSPRTGLAASVGRKRNIQKSRPFGLLSGLVASCSCIDHTETPHGREQQPC